MTPCSNRALGCKRCRKQTVLQAPDLLSGLSRDALCLSLAGLVQTMRELGLSLVKQGVK
jgi:hypothetical protein